MDGFQAVNQDDLDQKKLNDRIQTAENKAPKQTDADAIMEGEVDENLTPIAPVSRKEEGKMSKAWASIRGKKKVQKNSARNQRGASYFNADMRKSVEKADNVKTVDEQGNIKPGEMDRLDESKPGAMAEGDRIYLNSETFRLFRKEELLRSADFEDRMPHTAEFQHILDLIRNYARINVTGDDHKDEDHKAEIRAFQELITAVDSYRKGSARDEDDVSRERDLAEAYFQRLEPLWRGELKIDMTGENGKYGKPRMIDRTKVTMFTDMTGKKKSTVTMQEVPKEEPLFPHEPSLNDIRQVGLGDCYLLSSLSSVVNNNPDFIRGCMSDGGNGTVTVRFYDVEASKDKATGKDQYRFTPVYVTVKKQVPANRNYAKGALWPQLFEQAYAAAGLGNNRKKTEAIRTETEDKKKQRKTTVDYSEIEGGSDEWFLMQLKGEPAEKMEIDMGYQALFNAYRKVMNLKAEEKKKTMTKDDINLVNDTLKRAKKAIRNSSKEDQELYLSFQNVLYLTKDLFGEDLNEEFGQDLIHATESWLFDLYNADRDKNKTEFSRLLSYEDFRSVTYVAKSKLSDAPVKPIYQEIVNNHIEFENEVRENKREKGIKEGLKTDEEILLEAHGLAQKRIERMKETFCLSFRNMLKENQKLFSSEKQRMKTGQKNSFGQTAAGSDADNLYHFIEEKLGEGKALTTHSQAGKWFERRSRLREKEQAGFNGEKGSLGIYGSHDYAILGVRPRGDRRYVMLRNPWGQGIREYYLESGSSYVLEKANYDDISTHGIFLVDINNFNEFFGNVTAI
jgi:hypothetical protein